MESETEINFRNGDFQSCFECFADMRRERELCDITFNIRNSSISAHRVVIAASLPYFRKSLSGEEEDAVLLTVDPDTFECFVEYAYSHEMKINMENVRNLLSGACYFQVEEVKEACCDFLCSTLQPENVIELRDLACCLHCWNLLENTNRYIKENFVAVSQTEDFLNVPFLYMNELIGSDDLLVSNEEKVFEAIMKWIKTSSEERKDNLAELLRKVRMPLLKLNYVTDTVGEEEMIRTSIPCRDLLDEAKDCLLLPNRKESTSSFSTTPRRMMRHVDNNKNTKKPIYNLTVTTTYTIECFQANKKVWKTIYHRTNETNASAVAELKNELYFFHGDNSVQYNIKKNEFRYIKRTSLSRCYAGAVSLKSKIIICGGSIETTALNTVESLDPQTDEWSSLSSMRRHRAGPSVVALDDYIYVFGGTDYTCVHDSVERYDSETGKWSIVSRMLTKRHMTSAATLKNKIYICGGDSSCTAGVANCISTAEVFNPNENTWHFISPMKIARYQTIGFPHREKLYVLGGFDGDGKHVSAVEIYNPVTDKWESGPPTTHAQSWISWMFGT